MNVSPSPSRRFAPTSPTPGKVKRRRSCRCRRAITRSLRRARGLPRRVFPTSGPARCWASWANPVPANPPCCAASPGWTRPIRRTHHARRLGEEMLDLHRARGACPARALMRSAWGIVHQNPRDGLRMDGLGRRQRRREADGRRLYVITASIREAALDWLGRVEIDGARIDDRPTPVLRRHAAAPADRPRAGLRAAPRLHGRADGRPRRLSAGEAARPAAGAGA